MAAGSLFSVAPNPPRPVAKPEPPRSTLASQGRLPLAFMFLGLAWLGAATALLLVRPGTLALPHAAPAVVTLVHAWVLGVFVTIATGAVYQIAPVALGATLWSERYGWWHFGLQAVSVPGMVFALSRWDMALLGHFGTAFALGIGLFGLNTWQTVRRAARHDAVAWALVLSAGWLLLTAAAGLAVAANRFWHFLPFDPLALLRAHAHLGLVGFFVTLLQGVTFRLVPMFTLANVTSWRPVWIGLGLSQMGLIALVPGLAWGADALAFPGATCVLAGMAVSGFALRQTLRRRRKRSLDAGLRAFVSGLVVLGLAALAGWRQAWPVGLRDSLTGGFNANVYGIAIFFGGLLPVFAGMLGRIVPFLTWMRAYGPKVGRVPTPAASTMTNPHLEAVSLGLIFAAVIPLAVGCGNESEILLLVGAAVLAIGIVVFLLNMARVLRHLWRPGTPTPLAARNHV